MAPFLRTSLPLVTSALLSSEPPQCRRLEVCTSPGCVADGAMGTLKKLKALAPPSSQTDPGIVVKEGRCASACGSGPVVIETSGPIARNEDGIDASTTADARVVHKWIKDEALLRLLEGGADDANDGNTGEDSQRFLRSHPKKRRLGSKSSSSGNKAKAENTNRAWQKGCEEVRVDRANRSKSRNSKGSKGGSRGNSSGKGGKGGSGKGDSGKGKSRSSSSR